MNEHASLLGQLKVSLQNGDSHTSDQITHHICSQFSQDPTAMHSASLLHVQYGNLEIACSISARCASFSPQFKRNYGDLLCKTGQFGQALSVYRELLNNEPEASDLFRRFGNVFRIMGSFDSAERSYKMALRFDAENFETLTNLGNICRLKGSYSEAIEFFEKATLHKKNAIVLNNHALVLSEIGEITKAEALYREALNIDPCNKVITSNYCLCLCYNDDSGPGLFEAHKKAGKIFDGKPDTVAFVVKSKLRIGYVSPDFKDHPVAHFIYPVFKNHDRSKFDIFCYSETPFEDKMTSRLRSCGHQWRQTHGLTDGECVSIIEDDKIDILVDLAGHTDGNRLGCFGMKPAPIQVSYLGYPATTGLLSIDYRFTDAIADPATEDSLYSEKLYRLDGSFLCYAPPDNAPEIRIKYDQPGKPIRFGSCASLAKVNSTTIRLWADALKAVPFSTMCLKRKPFNSQYVCELFYRRFEKEGIPRERVFLNCHTGEIEKHFEWYNEIDIILDTYPYCGTTTTCEALFMGVPVITLTGTHHVSRVSTSILHAIGLDDLICIDQEAYVRTLQLLVSNPSKMEVFNRTLRKTFCESILCNGKQFTGNLEKAYVEMSKTLKSQL